MALGNKRGITLVELLLAVTLLSLVIAAVVELPRLTHDAWTQSARHSELQANGRLGLEFVVRALREAKSIVEVSGSGNTNGYVRYKDSGDTERRIDRRLDAGLGRQVLAYEGSAVADELDSFEVTGLKDDATTETIRAAFVQSVVVAMTFSDPEGVAPSLSVSSTVRIRRVPPVVPDILVLASSGKNAFKMQDAAVVNAPDLGVMINSSDDKALSLSAGKKGDPCSLSAGWIRVVGNIEQKDGSVITPTPTTGATAIADPLADLSPPDTTGSCDYTSFTLSGGASTLYPGVYCNGILLESNAIANLEPGNYIIRGGGVTVQTGASIRGDGVCFYLTSGDGYDFSGLLIDAGDAQLSAPTTGEMADILFFADRTLGSGKGSDHEIKDFSTWELEGTLYFPDQKLKIKDDAIGAGDAAWTQIIADQLELKNGSIMTLQAQ